MSSNGQNIIQIFERFAPKYLALPEDKVGLQIGTLNKEIQKVLLTLDVLDNVVDEAIEKKIDLIIAHHSLIFKPLKNVRTDLPQGALIEKLIKNDISVYVAHTNLDMAIGGVNDVLAKKIGLEKVEVLEVNYIDETREGLEYGIGRKGRISEPVPLSSFVEDLKNHLDIDGVRVIGDLDKIIKKVAIVGGDGDNFINKAIFSGVDVLVTGDVYYHTAHNAMASGMAIVDVGHYIEKHVMVNVKKFLEEEFQSKKLDVEIIISKENTNPFKFL